MQIQPENIAELIFKQQRNELTALERDLLAEWVNASPANKLLADDLQELTQSLPFASHINTAGKEVLERVKELRPELAYQRRLRTANIWWRYAAAIIIIASVAIFMFIDNQQPVDSLANRVSVEIPDVLPGGDRAILTLSDGTTIILDSAMNGMIAQQGKTLITKTGDGELSYKSGAENDKALTNTVSTPKGGQYRISLPDGTNVWLNAASSISYPTVFQGSERIVNITGEAFFEVAKDPLKPFIVRTASDIIQVVGTSFNVNSYAEESGVKTSLMEGAVKIGNILLNAGQAHINGKLVITNIDQDVAWKNGIFNFNNVDLEVVMRQIARWYDVEIGYPNGVPSKRIKGEMGRNLNLSEVILVLKDIGVNTQLKDKKLNVLNN